MKEPAAIGKTTTIVNQGKSFVIKIRYTWARKARAQNQIEKNFLFDFEHEFLPVKNVFVWCFLKRINKLDPYFELFHAINKLEYLRNLSDKRTHTSYNQHSPLFLGQKLFA